VLDLHYDNDDSDGDGNYGDNILMILMVIMVENDDTTVVENEGDNIDIKWS